MRRVGTDLMGALTVPGFETHECQPISRVPETREWIQGRPGGIKRLNFTTPSIVYQPSINDDSRSLNLAAFVDAYVLFRLQPPRSVRSIPPTYLVFNSFWELIWPTGAASQVRSQTY